MLIIGISQVKVGLPKRSTTHHAAQTDRALSFSAQVYSRSSLSMEMEVLH